MKKFKRNRSSCLHSVCENKLIHEGFTLIELLATIVIIAIVAVIATPIIRNMIEDVKREAFIRSVEFAMSQYDFVRQTSSVVTQIDASSDELKLQHNNFTNGSIVTNEEQQAKALYVSDGNYCAIGILGKLRVTKGNCVIDNDKPNLKIEKIVSIDNSKLTLRIKATDEGVGLHNKPYSFDNGITWQEETDRIVTSSYNGIILVRDIADNESSIDYSISKLTIDGNTGVLNGLNSAKIYWLEKNEEINLPKPIKIGYEFTEWTKVGNGIIDGTIFRMQTEETSLTANYIQSIFVLTVNPNGGIWNGTTNSTVFSKEYASETEIQGPTRVGYTFNGWKVSGTGSSISGTIFTMGNADTSIIAEWLPNKYTLTINLDGGTWNGMTGVQKISLGYGETLQLPDPIRRNYYFKEWELQSTNSQLDGKVFTMGTSDATLNVNWHHCVGTDSYTYTGNSQYISIDEEKYKIKFLTSGTLHLNCPTTLDVFLVGGGSSHGGGGYTKTERMIHVNPGDYKIVVGLGSTPSSANGGSSSAFGYSVLGGQGINGGSGAGVAGYVHSGSAGGSNGGAGADGINGGVGGTGQGSTTREFGEPSGALYAGGGGGGAGSGCRQCAGEGHKLDYTAYGGSGGAGGGGAGGQGSSCANGVANTGGGAGTANRGTVLCSGGSGIVIIRNIVYNGNDIYEYSGNSEFVNEGNGNYKIRLLTTGTLVLKKDASIDLFMVGGGSSGGGSGKTRTIKKIDAVIGQQYQIVVGLGGIPGSDGDQSTAFGYSIEGGVGNSGGSGAGAPGYVHNGAPGGSNGGSGKRTVDNGAGGTGQGTTTREFGEPTGALYAGGGGGGAGSGCRQCAGEDHKLDYTAYGGAGGSGGGGAGGQGSSCQNGGTNTGGGAGTGVRGQRNCSGGSGIVIIRNAR